MDRSVRHLERLSGSNLLHLTSQSTKGAFLAGTRIACTYVPFPQSSAPVILFSHSNADDIGTIIRHLRLMSRILYCHVFAYDYSGYGLSEGKASIKNLYSDCEAAYLALRFYCGFNQDDIIFYGASLGSVAAAHLAAKYSCKGLIMMASVPSGIRLLCRGTAVRSERDVSVRCAGQCHIG